MTATQDPKICKCLRCGHEWVKRIEGRPAQCPACKQPRWDIGSTRRRK